LFLDLLFDRTCAHGSFGRFVDVVRPPRRLAGE